MNKHLTSSVLLVMQIGLGVLLLSFSMVSWSSGDAEYRGQRVYSEGLSNIGSPIEATIGSQNTKLPASAVPCINCHGEGGLGKPEASVRPPPITWFDLIKPQGQRIGEVIRPPYNDELIRRAVLSGINSSGKVMNQTMPRYSMHESDMTDLLTYLKRLGTANAPGVTDAELKIGTILPDDKSRMAQFQSMLQIIQAHFAEVNAAGGIFQRKVVLSIPDEVGNGQVADTQANVFALLTPHSVNQEMEVQQLAEQHKLPIVAPYTSSGARNIESDWVFFLLSGRMQWIGSLVRYSQANIASDTESIFIVYPEGSDGEDIVNTMRYLFKPIKVGSISYDLSSLRLDPSVKQGQVPNNILYLGEPSHWWELNRSLNLGKGAKVYFPGPEYLTLLKRTSREMLYEMVVAVPTLRSDLSLASLKYLALLHKKYQIEGNNIAAQVFALSAAKLLTEGVKVGGRSLTRKKFVTALEGIYQWDSGLTPKLSYGPNRRIGSKGAYILTSNLARPVWIDAE